MHNSWWLGLALQAVVPSCLPQGALEGLLSGPLCPATSHIQFCQLLASSPLLWASGFTLPSATIFNLAAVSCVAGPDPGPQCKADLPETYHSSFPMHVRTLVSSLASAPHLTDPRRPVSLQGKWVWEARAVTSPESVTSPCLRISARRTMALWFLQSLAF